jgi:ATP-dependent exoDNAse (exonuclease V) beta subunit
VASPTAVTQEAAERFEDEIGLDTQRVQKAAGGRFGHVFGSTVHRAIELILSGATDTAGAAVTLAAREAGLKDHLAEAAADVERARGALATIGVGCDPQLTVSTEYPVAMQRDHGVLLSGFVDLLLSDASTVTVIDYKTDRPLHGDLAAVYPRYTRQLRLYGDMLRVAQIVGARRLRLGLLLTALGELRWLD